MGKNYLNGSFFSFLLCLTFLPHQSPNPALTHFLPLEKFYLLSSFIPSAPLILVGVRFLPHGWYRNYTHSFIKPVGAWSYFLITSHITESSHFFGTRDRNQPWFQWLVNRSFGFLVLGVFFPAFFQEQSVLLISWLQAIRRCQALIRAEHF